MSSICPWGKPNSTTTTHIAGMEGVRNSSKLTWRRWRQSTYMPKKEMLPVKYTFSLARDFPLQFGQLHRTGECTFQTLDRPLRAAYPGTYGHRILVVQLTLGRVSLKSPLRGLLGDDDFSAATKSDGSALPSIRPADALPISEFSVTTSSAQLNNFPGNTLMPLEEVA
jgi:hypothetical protein